MTSSNNLLHLTNLTMNAIYTMPAIDPHCKEVRERVEVIEWRRDRVLLRSLEKKNYLIEADLSSIELEIPIQ